RSRRSGRSCLPIRPVRAFFAVGSHMTCTIYRSDISWATMLELAVLGLLAEQPRHGYDLKKRLSETLGPLWGISFGSLYPALRRLERDGAIEEVADSAGSPVSAPFVPTGSLKGDLAAARMRLRARPTRRTRRAYAITAHGRAMFTELLT